MTEEQLDKAYVNSFRVIILGYDIDEIHQDEGDVVVFAHNALKRVPTRTDLENLLTYFSEVEDFEKCIAIKTYLRTHR